jgi:hypothetical protein
VVVDEYDDGEDNGDGVVDEVVDGVVTCGKGVKTSALSVVLICGGLSGDVNNRLRMGVIPPPFGVLELEYEDVGVLLPGRGVNRDGVLGVVGDENGREMLILGTDNAPDIVFCKNHERKR